MKIKIITFILIISLLAVFYLSSFNTYDGRPKKEVIELAKKMGNIYPLILNSDTKGIKDCIQNNLNINLTNDQGYTPLLFAIENNKKKVFKYLLECGADPTVLLGNKYSSVVATAIRNPDAYYIKECLKIKFDINFPDNRGERPLCFAIMEYNQNIIKLLVEQGASPIVENKYGSSSYITAISMRNFKAALFFLEKGFSPKNTSELHLESFIFNIKICQKTISKKFKGNDDFKKVLYELDKLGVKY